MNVLAWAKFVQLPAVSKGVHLWSSYIGPLLTRIARPEQPRIVVRIIPGGFEASLLPSDPKGELQCCWQDGRGWQPEAAFHRLLHSSRQRPVELVLSELTLTQSVKLPDVARSNLSDAITYGLPSWSPFEADEVYVTGHVEEVWSGQATIRLHYVLRTKADPIIERLGAAGLPADRIVLDPLANQALSLPTAKSARLRKARRIDAALAVTAVCLALLLGSFRVMVLSQRLEEAQALLRTELAQLRQTEALQAVYGSFVARRAAVSDRLATEVGAYEVLVALAQHLPDGTLIQSLELNGGHVRMDLVGVDPANAFEALRSVPMFRNVRSDARGPQAIAISFELGAKVP